MRRHKTIMTPTRSGLFVIMTFAAFSLWIAVPAFSSITTGTEQAPVKAPQVGAEAKALPSISLDNNDAQTSKPSGFFLLLTTPMALFVFTVLLTSAGCLLGFAIYIHRAVTIPLGRLREGANEIRRGNLDHQVAVQGSGDIALLAGQFNEMAEALKSARRDLEQKRIERMAEVERLNGNYQDLFENAGGILFTMDLDGRLTSANHAAELFTGHSKKELIGGNVRDFPELKWAGPGGELLAGEPGASCRLTEFEIDKQDNSRAVVEAGLRRLFTDRIPVGCLVSVRDLTEQKQLQEKLLAAERLGAADQAQVTIRHAINNPLTTVIGNLELLIQRYEQKDRDLTARLEVALNNALRIADITARKPEFKREKSLGADIT